MNCRALVQEVRSLFQSGKVPITLEHVFRGRGGILEFSPEVMDALWLHMRESTKSILGEFQSGRRMRAVQNGGSSVEAELFADNYRLKVELSKERTRSAAAKEKLEEMKTSFAAANTELSRANNKNKTAKRTLKSMRLKMRTGKLMRMPDGTYAKPVPVDNIAFDPFAERPAEDKGKRAPFICYKWGIIWIKGNKEPRPGTRADGKPIGGWRYTTEARRNEFLNACMMGLSSFRRNPAMREMHLHARTASMMVVPTDIRRKFARGRPMMRLLDSPSRSSTVDSIIPSFNLLFFYYVSALLRDQSTLMIGICGDGTHVSGFGVFGAVFSVYQWHKGEEDPLGNVLFVFTCKRFNGPLVRTANKFVKTLRDAHGNKFPPEAGICFAKILWGANVATLFLLRPDMFALVFDGASENTGEGGASAKASLCGPGSIFDTTVNDHSAWIHLQEQAENSGLADTVHEFFGIKAFEWPKAVRDLGTPLNVSGPVIRDPAVVKALDAYPTNPKYAWLRTDNWLKLLDGDPDEIDPGEFIFPVLRRKHERIGILRQYLVSWTSMSTRKWQREQDWQLKRRCWVLWGFECQMMQLSNEDDRTRFLLSLQPEIQKICFWGFECQMMQLSNEDDRTRFLISLQPEIQKILQPLIRKGEVQNKVARQKRGHGKEFRRRMQESREFAAERHKDESFTLYLRDLVWFLKRKRGRHVSMELNPAVFLHGLPQPDANPLPVATHCACHRAQLLADLFIFCLNADLLHQAVSFNKFLRCDYHFPQLKAAMNALLKRLKEGETRPEFFQKILDKVDAAALISLCHFDEEKGAEKPVVAALTRWGTTLACLSNMYRKHRIYAFAIIPCFAHGPEGVLVEACVDILSEQGFDSEKMGQMRLEKCAELVFNFLTRPSDILQTAIGHVLHVCAMQILLAAVSANHECGAPLSQGMESLVRSILLMFRRDFFVRIFPGGGWGRSWNRRAAIGCRTHGAEFRSASSIRLLNGHCSGKVKERLRLLNMEHLADEASRAIPEYLATAKMLAKRKGPMLPEDSMHIWKRCFPELAEDEYVDSYVARMSQAQWLFVQVAEDVVEAVIKWCLRELYHMYGFIANTGKTVKSNKAYTFEKADKTTYQSEALIPGPFAHANAVVTLVQGRDMIAHYKELGISREELLRRLPKPVAGCLSEEGTNQIRQFLGINEDADNAFLELIAKIGGDEAVNAPFYRGCHLPEEGRDRAVKEDGRFDLSLYRQLRKATSCFPKLVQHSAEASNTQSTSKPIEGAFSPLTANARVRGAPEMPLMSGVMQQHNYKSAGMDPRTADEAKHWEAVEAVKNPAWKSWYFARDDKKGFDMHMADMQRKLPKKVQKGQVHLYRDPHHGGCSRTKKYRGLNPSSNTKEGRRLLKTAENVSQRMKKGVGFRFKGVDKGVEGVDNVGTKMNGGAANEAAPAAKRKRTNAAAKNRAMASLGAAKSAKRGKARPAGGKSTANLQAPAQAARETAIPVESSKIVRPQPSDDPDYSGGEDQTAAIGPAQGDARRSVRSRREVDYLESQADEEPPPQPVAEVECAVAVGSQVQVYWEGEWKWCPGTVTKISGGQVQHPTRMDEIVVKGYAIVHYDKQRGHDAMDCVHNLDRAHHVDEFGEKKFAWRERPQSQGIGDGGRSVSAEANGPASRSGLQPGGTDRDQVATADFVNADGAQGSKKSKRAGEVDSSSSDVSDDSSDGYDDHRTSSRAGKSKAPNDAPAPVTCAVQVGARIQVRWKDGQGGWSTCTVLQISTGKTRNPRNSSEWVVKGYAIVEYPRRWRCAHNLDRAHHVDTFGDREWAWREYKEQSPAVSRAGRKGKASSKGGPRRTSAESDDDAPLLASKGGNGDRVGSDGASGGARDPAAPSGGAKDSVPSPWSLSFCEKYYQASKGISRSKAEFDAAAGTYSVTRRPVKGVKPHTAVQFSVVAGSGRMFYIAHTVETGPIIINVRNVYPPRDEDWTETLKCYCMFTSVHAGSRAVDTDDKLSDKGDIETLGKLSLRAQASDDERLGKQTYHCGDVLYSMDVRSVVGVVRWAPLNYMSGGFTDNYWIDCPLEAELIYVGKHFRQVQ